VGCAVNAEHKVNPERVMAKGDMRRFARSRMLQVCLH
jgi:hypothetical protein